MSQAEHLTAAETNGEKNGAANKKLSVERIYQKKSQLEHILLRPDTYIGSVEHITEMMWVYDNEKSALTQREITYVPGLYKIFDEILVNAADNKVRDPKMDTIRVDIDAENNAISVYNNGKGIPVVMHKDEKMYVPSLIFGHLLTSSNYNDEEEKVTGGRNGYGAKLCNIFSTKFVLETTSKEYKKSFKQTWKNNMGTTAEPNIQSHSKGEDYTRVTFSPDLPKFKMTSLDKDTVALLSKRAFDVAASTRGVKVYLNGKLLPIKSFKDYVELCLKGRDDEDGNNVKPVFESVNERWEIAIAPSDKGYQQVSFVNSIATTKGGRHVDYVTDMIVKQLQEHMKKKNKGGVAIKPHQVKNHIWVFVNCLIVNPTFDSQTKENMTLQTKSFGSKCQPTEKFYTQMMKSGIIESVMAWARFKAQNELNKQCSGKKHAKLKGIPKLEDANDAGTKNSINCTLILTEGDSAKSLAVSGLGVIGRDKYGVFPLKGKLLNVREATHKQILENAEINNLVKILGLQYKKNYENETDLKTLRYGKLMIMTDQDQDGSHIKGLLINFFHHNWPSLLRLPFLEEFITPIVKATKGANTSFSFYSLPEFEEWKSKTDNWPTFRIKYYKGLGTSTSQEAKSYFSDMQRHRIMFRYDGDQDDYAITMAFSKKHVEQRKEWLTSWMDECKRRRELGMAELYLYEKNTKQVNYRDFVNKELVLFSNLDNERSIPSLVDGLKPGQRKVLFTCIKRNDKKEIKVAQLAGSVAEHSAYHHGEASLMSTIIGLAQNYVGSNNINLLYPSGQFGTRLQGGKDAASPRYIFTLMSKLTRLIFHPHDDPLLCHLKDDNQRIEPEWYIPILPMVLVNGADGIGTGWMTKIPNFNPRDLAENIKRMLSGEEPLAMIPWFKGYRGTIEMLDPHRYACSGEVSVIDDNEIEITELPIRAWTQVYKESVMESLLQGTEKQPALINDYKEYHTDTTVRFVVNVTDSKLEKAEHEGLHRLFKLQTTLTTTSMVLFDANGCLKKYDNVEEILREFYHVRLRFYQKRMNYLEGVLQAESRKLSNQARFICEKCDGVLTVENKKAKALIEELKRRNYDPDPVRLWKLAQDKEAVLEQDAELDADLDADLDTEDDTSPVKSADFDYLLDMPMRSLTYEKKEDLLRKKEVKVAEYEILRKKTPADLWRADLDHFLAVLQEVEDSEMEEKSKKVVKMPMIKQRKKQLVAEVLPSPKGRRILPVIDAELRKKVELANKAKDARAKKALKSPEISIEKDSFDLEEMSLNKSLYERLGLESPVKGAAKKTSPAKAKKDSADGDSAKPTKLKFGSAKKKDQNNKDDPADDDSDKDEFDFMLDSAPLREKTSRRAAASVKYTLENEDVDSDELREDDTFQVSDSDEEFEFDKPKTAARKKPAAVATAKASAMDSDDESPAKKPKKVQPVASVSSDDLFDSLIGKTTPKKDEEPPKKVAAKDVFALESDDDMQEAPVKAPAKKPAASRPKKEPKEPKAKKEPKEPKAKKEPKEPKAKKEPKEPKAKKAPAAKKQRKATSDSDDDMFDNVDNNDAEPKQRGAQRARKAVKYDFDSDDSM